MNAGINGDVVGVTDSIAWKTYKEQQAELRRLSRIIARYKRIGYENMSNVQMARLGATYYARYIVRRYWGNPGHLPTYAD